MTSTLGLKQEQDFTFPRSWDMPKQPGPAGCLSHPKPAPETLFLGTVSSRGFQGTLGGGSDPHPQCPVPTFLSPIHPGMGSWVLPSSLHSIRGDPKQMGWAGRGGISSSASPDGIHTHLAKIPLPEQSQTPSWSSGRFISLLQRTGLDKTKSKMMMERTFLCSSCSQSHEQDFLEYLWPPPPSPSQSSPSVILDNSQYQKAAHFGENPQPLQKLAQAILWDKVW